MDLVHESFVRAQLRGITQRIAEQAEAHDWVLRDTPVLDWRRYLPPVTTAEGAAALDRYVAMCDSMAPEILQKRLWGTVGRVGLGNGAGRLVAALNLNALAEKAFLYLLTGGIAAIWAYNYASPLGQTVPRLDVLTGYLEPIYDPDNSEVIVGLYQCQVAPFAAQAQSRYRVTIYDYIGKRRLVWTSVAQPYNLSANPIAEPLLLRPDIVVKQQDSAGLPIGEIMRLRSNLIAEVVQHVRYQRMLEGQSFSLLALAGPWRDVQQLGVGTVLESTDATASASRVDPGNFEPVENALYHNEERLRRKALLPVSGLGNSAPSGEAISQANVAFRNACSADAALLSRLLSAGVASFATLVSQNPAEVEVSVNQELVRQNRIDEVARLVKDRLMSRREAINQIAVFYPTWSDADRQQFVADLEARVTPDDITAILGGES